jgi:hypothetical protein
MVNRIVGWLVLLPLSGLLIAFALANRHLVSVNLNPFIAPPDAASGGYGIPLFVGLYVVLLIGVLLGPHRRRERHWRREAQQLSQELEAHRRKPGAAHTPPMSGVDEFLDLR